MTKEYTYQPLVSKFLWSRDIPTNVGKFKVLVTYCYLNKEIVIRTPMDVSKSMFTTKLEKQLNKTISYYHNLLEKVAVETEEAYNYNTIINSIYFILDDLDR